MKNKLKVSTKGKLTAYQKEKKILNVLKNHKEGCNPKYISFLTGINNNTVKSILKKLLGEGIVKTSLKQRGIYELVEKSNHSIFFYKVQNLTLTYYSTDLKVNQAIKEENSLSEVIKFRFEIGSKSNKVTMNVSTKYPFEVTSLCIITRLFQELTHKHTQTKPSVEDICIATTELNNDYYGIRLDGAKCIRLNTLISEFKLYQKKNFVREEYKTKTPIRFDTIQRLLRQGIVNGELYSKVDSQEKEIIKMNKNVKSLRGNNTILLDGIFTILQRIEKNLIKSS